MVLWKNEQKKRMREGVGRVCRNYGMIKSWQGGDEVRSAREGKTEEGWRDAVRQQRRSRVKKKGR